MWIDINNITIWDKMIYGIIDNIQYKMKCYGMNENKMGCVLSKSHNKIKMCYLISIHSPPIT